MNVGDYDDDAVLAEYLTSNFQELMLPLESRALGLALKRQKAERNMIAADRCPKWVAQETADVIELSLLGHTAIQSRVRDRIMRENASSDLIINRCPQCHRIVRTSKAQQCLWCGYDWHSNA